MIYPIWRLSEYHPTISGSPLLTMVCCLAGSPLIERRDGRFVVREPSDIARLVKYSFPDGVAVDRLMPGLARVASALNANDQAAARIAAVHLHIPNLPGSAARNAMVAEDALIKYARDQGGDSDWNPDLHPRAGVPPNSGWFASTGGRRDEPSQDESSSGQSRLRIAANEDGSRRTDATSSADDQQTLQPGNPIDEPANLTDRPDWTHFWSDTWPAIKDWLEEPVPEYDIESGQRWRAAALASHCALSRHSRTRGIRIDDLIAHQYEFIVWDPCRDTHANMFPVLYWWTLLPASLAEQHGIPLSVLVGAAQEHIELEGQQHLLRFYEKPEDWQSAAVMAELYHSCPGDI